MEDKNIVLAEIPITGGQLHKIANGSPCLISVPGELFGIQFLLKNSFKVKSSNYVANNIIMQIIPLGKENVLRKVDMAVKTKIQTIIKEKEVIRKPTQKELIFDVKENKTELF